MGKLTIKNSILMNNRCYQQGVKRTPIGIQIHSIGTGQGTAQSVADYWNQSAVSACVTYIVDADVSGKVLKCLPEDYYTWADGGYGNRNLITIEICESDFIRYTSGAVYEINNLEKFKGDILRGYNTAVMLCADICKRYGWDPTSKLPSGLYLISSHDEGRRAGLSTAHVDPDHVWHAFDLTMDKFREAVKKCMTNGEATTDVEDHILYRVRKSWKDAGSQIGAFESLANAKNACPAGYSVYDEKGEIVYANIYAVKGTQASAFEGLSESTAAEKILQLVRATDTSGILYSVTAAQMILESGYVTTQLSKTANNCFGMKASLSGNTWESVWDGKSVVTINTTEVYDGKYVHVDAEFRKYPCIEDSIRDHSAYLLGAMNGNKKRYSGLLECTDYESAVKLIKNGGYATDPNYVSKLCSIIRRFDLDRYDISNKKTVTKKTKYRVQVGAFTILKNANAKKDEVKKITGFATALVTNDNGSVSVICGSFQSRENAKKRVEALKKYGIYSIVKEV